jgi:hypothetical protein
MSNVDTRMQDFYNRGRQDAVDEILDFLDQLSRRLDDRVIPQDTSAGVFIRTMEKVMSETFTRSPDTDKA